jgi:hypothetical protein
MVLEIGISAQKCLSCNTNLTPLPPFLSFPSELDKPLNNVLDRVDLEIQVPQPAGVDFTDFFAGFWRIFNRCLCRKSAEEIEEKHTQEERFETIHFVDYRPLTFRKIRENFGISSEQYRAGIKNIGKVSISEGASGAFMMFTEDKKYIIKSCTLAEMLFLSDAAKDFKKHYKNHKETLLCRIYGLHKLTLYGQASFSA